MILSKNVYLLPKLNHQEISYKIKIWEDWAHSHQNGQGCTEGRSEFLSEVLIAPVQGWPSGHPSPGPWGLAERESQRRPPGWGGAGWASTGRSPGPVFSPPSAGIELTTKNSNQELPWELLQGQGGPQRPQEGWQWEGLYAGLELWGMSAQEGGLSMWG